MVTVTSEVKSSLDQLDYKNNAFQEEFQTAVEDIQSRLIGDLDEKAIESLGDEVSQALKDLEENYRLITQGLPSTKFNKKKVELALIANAVLTSKLSPQAKAKFLEQQGVLFGRKYKLADIAAILKPAVDSKLKQDEELQSLEDEKNKANQEFQELADKIKKAKEQGNSIMDPALPPALEKYGKAAKALENKKNQPYSFQAADISAVFENLEAKTQLGILCSVQPSTAAELFKNLGQESSEIKTTKQLNVLRLMNRNSSAGKTKAKDLFKALNPVEQANLLKGKVTRNRFEKESKSSTELYNTQFGQRLFASLSVNKQVELVKKLNDETYVKLFNKLPTSGERHKLLNSLLALDGSDSGLTIAAEMFSKINIKYRTEKLVLSKQKQRQDVLLTDKIEDKNKVKLLTKLEADPLYNLLKDSQLEIKRQELFNLATADEQKQILCQLGSLANKGEALAGDLFKRLGDTPELRSAFKAIKEPGSSKKYLEEVNRTAELQSTLLKSILDSGDETFANKEEFAQKLFNSLTSVKTSDVHNKNNTIRLAAILSSLDDKQAAKLVKGFVFDDGIFTSKANTNKVRVMLLNALKDKPDHRAAIINQLDGKDCAEIINNKNTSAADAKMYVKALAEADKTSELAEILAEVERGAWGRRDLSYALVHAIQDGIASPNTPVETFTKIFASELLMGKEKAQAGRLFNYVSSTHKAPILNELCKTQSDQAIYLFKEGTHNSLQRKNILLKLPDSNEGTATRSREILFKGLNASQQASVLGAFNNLQKTVRDSLFNSLDANQQAAVLNQGFGKLGGYSLGKISRIGRMSKADDVRLELFNQLGDDDKYAVLSTTKANGKDFVLSDSRAKQLFVKLNQDLQKNIIDKLSVSNEESPFKRRAKRLFAALGANEQIPLLAALGDNHAEALFKNLGSADRQAEVLNRISDDNSGMRNKLFLTLSDRPDHQAKVLGECDDNKREALFKLITGNAARAEILNQGFFRLGGVFSANANRLALFGSLLDSDKESLLTETKDGEFLLKTSFAKPLF